MKRVPALLLLSFALVIPAFAQDWGTEAALEAACGPKEEKFEVKVDEKQHPNAQADDSKAIVYVVQDVGLANCLGNCLTTKVGMDGAWVGANAASSYIFFYAQPGDHHLCANVQSRWKKYNSIYSMAKFVAEAGKTYYFRVRFSDWNVGQYFDLDHLDSDEGEYLVASSPYSVWHAKK